MITAVHLGLGAFHRAHQAVYTAADPDAGIAAYTFRSTSLPDALTAQGGRYHLLIRSDDGPQLQEISSIVRARPGTDLESWRRDLSSGSVSVLTLTVTEAGYSDPATIARVLDGLAARRAGSGAPIALVPCDNLPGNGSVLRDALLDAADPGLGSWIDDHVGFVDTVVDRITPATTADDLADVASLLPPGVRDEVPVVTEPYSEWVLAGEFPRGRPAWPATFVDDAAPYARRKLWFLNGAHSLLAYVGPSRGASTVDEAVRIPEVARLMESWWDAAAPHADVLGLDDYRAALRSRFAQRGIRHRLVQIARDGSAKIPARILPVLALERAAGRLPDGAVGALAGWVAYLRGGDVSDPRAADLVPAARSGGVGAVLALLGSPEATALADDRELVRAVDTTVS